MESKDLLDLCRQAGIDVKNQLSSLDPDQRDAVEQMVKRGGGGVALAAPPKSSTVAPPIIPQKVRVLDSRPVARPPLREAEPPRTPVQPTVAQPEPPKPTPALEPAAQTPPPTPVTPPTP